MIKFTVVILNNTNSSEIKRKMLIMKIQDSFGLPKPGILYIYIYITQLLCCKVNRTKLLLLTVQILFNCYINNHLKVNIKNMVVERAII